MDDGLSASVSGATGLNSIGTTTQGGNATVVATAVTDPPWLISSTSATGMAIETSAMAISGITTNGTTTGTGTMAGTGTMTAAGTITDTGTINATDPTATSGTTAQAAPTGSTGWDAPGATHVVQVGPQDELLFTPQQVQAMPGDVVQFEFHRLNHTVTESSLDDPCTRMEGGFDSGFGHFNPSDAPGDFVAFDVRSNASRWFFCAQQDPYPHCRAGMVFALNPGADMNTFLINAQGLASTPVSRPVSILTSTPASFRWTNSSGVTVTGQGGVTATASANGSVNGGSMGTVVVVTSSPFPQSGVVDSVRPVASAGTRRSILLSRLSWVVLGIIVVSFVR